MAQISVTGSSLTYNQDFNSLGNPSAPTAISINGWDLAEYGTSGSADNMYVGGDGSLNAGNIYSFGVAGATERALGSVGSTSNRRIYYGATFTNNTGVSINGLSVAYTGEQWRKGASSVDTLRFEYSTNATGIGDTLSSATWTEVTALMFIAPNGTITDVTEGEIDGNQSGNKVTFSATNVTVSVPASSNLLIRWADRNSSGNDDGMAIDDLSITFTTGTPPPPSNKPNIVSLSPADNATGVAANANLVITFDRNITIGTGNITITNTTTPGTNVKTLPSPDVTVAGKVVTITNTGIATGNDYYVTFDSTAFDTAGFKSYGIYSQTQWNFSAGTTTPGVATSLNEDFNASCGAMPSNLPLGWTKVSVTGAQEWNCSSLGGYTGTAGVSINGFQGGSNNVNEDWLISPELNLSAMVNPTLNFRAFKKFNGNNITVSVSSNYAGDPTAATWNDLNVNLSAIDTNFKNFSASVAAYKANNFFIGFKYVSTANDGAWWKLDNINVAEPTAIGSVAHTSMPLTVVGNATQNAIRVAFTAPKAAEYTVTVTDLAGRVLVNNNVRMSAGTQQYEIANLNLTNGMYIVRLTDGSNLGVAKAIVQ